MRHTDLMWQITKYMWKKEDNNMQRKWKGNSFKKIELNYKNKEILIIQSCWEEGIYSMGLNLLLTVIWIEVIMRNITIKEWIMIIISWREEFLREEK